MGILRLSHVDVTVVDLDLAVAYYTEVIGMLVVERDENSVYLKCWDEPDHHSLRLVYAPRTGMEQMSFKVEKEDDLSNLENAVAKYGFPVSRVSKGESVGQGESIRFETPSGHVMELVHDIERVGRLNGSINPKPFVEGVPGIAPPRMDHILVTAEEVSEASKFYMDVLGFRLTEQLLDGDGHQVATWMERSHSPHDLAVVSGPTTGFRSMLVQRATELHAATRSTSSIHWAPAMRYSPVVTGRIQTSQRSPGPRTTSAAQFSTTRVN